MKQGLLIADFTGVYAEEGFLQKLQERGVPYRLVGLGDIEGTTCYCDPAAEAEISRRLVPEPGERMNNDWNAKNYTNNFSFVHQYGEDVLKLIDAPAGSSVLDVGCGISRHDDQLF